MHARGRLVRLALGAALVLGSVTAVAPATVASANSAIESFSLSGSPFAAAFAPLPTQVTLNLSLVRDAQVTITIRRPNGTRVIALAKSFPMTAGDHSWTWNGITERGRIAGDGTYTARVLAVSATGTERVDRSLRKGLPSIFPANPGVLVVAVDPGHGGRFTGAVSDGYMEKDFNLDIGLQLQALLEHAGVQVVMSRTTDVAVDEPASDENGDGVLDRYDDDLLRDDSANIARADVDVHVHNNFAPGSTAHGTATYTSRSRTWTPQATDLATLMLHEEMTALQAYTSVDFRPRDRGVHYGWYYYVGPYDPPFLPRPALPVSVLSESLFLSNPAELAALRRPDVRLSIAAAIYLGLADYLNTRPYGAGYALTSAAPSGAIAGSTVAYHLKVTNRGNVASDGWTLQLGIVPQVPVYDGSGAYGAPIGSIAVPDGLQAGQSVQLAVDATMPAQPGDWLVKTDITLSDGSRLSDAGIVPLQLPLTTTIAP